jgi:ATP-binding protein involved in chromosome partitioning
MRIFRERRADAECESRAARGTAAPGVGLSGVRAAVAIASAKGGVGKSAVTVNLAAALALAGHKVGILDADLNSPNVLAMLGLQAPRRVFAGDVIEPIAGPLGLRVAASGLLPGGEPPPVSFLDGDAAHEAASHNGSALAELDYDDALRRLLGMTNFGALDVLLIDLAPGLEQLFRLARIAPLAGAIIVTQPSDFAVRAARGAVEIARLCAVPVLGLIENMVGFSCEGCHSVRPLLPHGDLAAAAAADEVATLARLPFDSRLAESCDRGVIFIRAYAESPLAKNFHELARLVALRLKAAAAAEPHRLSSAPEEVG